VEVAEYARIAAAEDAHWWYRNTRSLIGDLLADHVRPGVRVLDAGCGPGGNSAWLLEQGEVVGIDPAPEAVRFAEERHPGMEVSLGDIASLEFADSSFDIVLVITVLALVEDDARAVREVARVLRPGGVTFLIEPAIPRLRRDHDAVTRILRRYRLGQLEDLAHSAGLEVRRATYAYSFLVPVALALAAWHRLKPAGRPHHSDLERDRLGWLFGPLASAERRWLSRRDLPLGLSAIVVAEQPASVEGRE
jgi:ubiquinone/menaquinone biosynthesis C-methylase UbiE